MSDPFDALHLPDSPIRPRARFVAELRRDLAAALGLDASEAPHPDPIRLPERRPFTMNPSPASTLAPATARVTPYLAVDDGAAALDFYTRAFGAVEVMRVVGDDGRIGHAELAIGSARIYLSDEYPEIGVTSPRTVGGTAVALHLEVGDVDTIFTAAVAAGATALAEPADQPHGARHGTLVDPSGHRWMLSQQIEEVTAAAYGERVAGQGWTVAAGGDSGVGDAVAPGGDGIWSGVNALDAPALIRFAVEVLGFDEQLVVPGAEPGVVEHSQLRWPEGGIVMVASAHRPGNPFSERAVGAGNLYVVTTDPGAVHRRCLAAGVTVVLAPSSPDYDPGGMTFTVADPEGNLWSFGTYTGETGAEPTST